MYTLFFDGLQSLCQQTALGFKIYTDLLQSNTQLHASNILSGDTARKVEGQIQPFPKRNTPAHHGDHQVLCCNFRDHHSISFVEWEEEMKRDFDDHIEAILGKFVGTSQEVQQGIMKYSKEFYRYNYLYTSHLLNPLFTEEHYEQFKRKHIGVQGKEDNVIFAFAFSPEEMSLYKNLNSLNLSWKNKKKSIISGLSRVIQSVEDIRGDYEKIRLFGSDEKIETSNQENWSKTILSEIINFMNMIERFDPESYLLFERELLVKSHQEMKIGAEKKN